ncbi:MAG: hypothetical protein CVU05_02020 [Bacteroidetes bacterium HGW-Bacteroidetes-21]|nr:MAG: hypothetical protein CVU05_02020 [Bacteroidetes bacterium HGW-Bacteroidetes-21]
MTLIKSQTILQDLQSKILAGQESRKGVSTLFFKSAKYIRKNSALEKAVLKLLNIETFPQNENQGFYRVPSKNPKAIILCENMYFLTLNIAQSNDIELWCAGGNNTKPIENIPKIDYPIFYLCDWDYDGLKIFERLLEIVEKTPTKKTSLQLLSPKGKRENIIATHDHHRSQWKQEIKFSGLTPSCYTSEQIQLINNLIVNNEWIEEESNDLGLIINKINSELAR